MNSAYECQNTKKVTSQGQAVGATEIKKINDVFSAATRPCCTHSVPGWFPPLAIQSSLAYVFKTQTSSDLNYNLCSVATTCMFVSVRNRVNGNITTVTELAENHQQLTKKPYNQSTSRTWLQHAGREKLTYTRALGSHNSTTIRFLCQLSMLKIVQACDARFLYCIINTEYNS